MRKTILTPIIAIAVLLVTAGSALAHDIKLKCVGVTESSVTLAYYGEGLGSGQTIPKGTNTSSEKNYFNPAGNVSDTTNQPSTFYNGWHEFTVPYNGQQTVYVVKHRDMSQASYVKFPDDKSEHCKTPPPPPKGKIIVCKALVPSDDSGRFDLKVDATVVKSSAGNGDCGEGWFELGDHVVSESGTSLGDYDSSVECVSEQQEVDPPGTSITVTLHGDETIKCTFTNTHKTPPPPEQPPTVTPPTHPPVVTPPTPPKKHHPRIVRIKLKLPFFNQDPPKQLAQAAKSNRYGCRIVGPRTKLHGLAHWRVKCRRAKVLPGWKWYISGQRVHNAHWTYTSNKGRTLNSWLFDQNVWTIPNIWGHYTITAKGRVRVP